MDDRLSKLISIFQELATLYAATSDVYRMKAYNTAIQILKTMSMRDIVPGQKIRGIGDRIRLKIDEFISTGNVAELDTLRQLGREIAVLSSILGVGPVIAKKWRNLGITSIAELRKAVGDERITLTNMQKYGLLYYEKLTIPVPRNLVEKIGNYWCKYFNSKCEIVGSYRRGKDMSNDVDILMSNIKTIDVRTLIDKHADCILIMSGHERITFLQKYNTRMIHVDILITEPTSWACALFYFTGSKLFNERIRGEFRKLGYKLNQRNLIDPRGEIVPIASEQDIFNVLGLQYIPPNMRTH